MGVRACWCFRLKVWANFKFGLLWSESWRRQRRVCVLVLSVPTWGYASQKEEEGIKFAGNPSWEAAAASPAEPLLMESGGIQLWNLGNLGLGSRWSRAVFSFPCLNTTYCNFLIFFRKFENWDFLLSCGQADKVKLTWAGLRCLFSHSDLHDQAAQLALGASPPLLAGNTQCGRGLWQNGRLGAGEGDRPPRRRGVQGIHGCGFLEPHKEDHSCCWKLPQCEVCSWVFLLSLSALAGGWTRWPPEVPSNPEHSVILCDSVIKHEVLLLYFYM